MIYRKRPSGMPAPRPAPISDPLAKLAKMGAPRLYRKNEIVIAEGEKSDALFILASGQLKVFTSDANGREVVYNILSPGELFGEMFIDGGPRSASVKATVASECVVLEQARIHDLIRKQPDFAQCLIQVLATRLRRATAMIKSLVLSDVRGRTTALIGQLAVIEGKLKLVPKHLTQQEIADRVGATREMINHVIKELIKDGLLSRDDNRRLVLRKDFPTAI